MHGMRTKRILAGLAAGTVLLTAAMGGTSAQETATVQAFATWELHAVGVPSGPEEVTIVGSLDGPVFVDSGQGPMPAGTVVCPGTLTVMTADGSQSGEGVCAFRATDGAQAWGHWTCSGYHLVGCRGDFAFTGGTDRLAGIAGGSELLIRSEIVTAMKGRDGSSAESVLGIMVWRNLTATLPE